MRVVRLILWVFFCAVSLGSFGQEDLEMAHKLYEDGEYEAVIAFVHSFEIRHEEDLLLEADAQHKLKEYKTAEEAYTQVLARDENNVYALMRRGAVQLEMGEFAFALKDVRKALKLWPEHPEANFHMGNICYDQNDLKTAVKYYKKAIVYRPAYPQATYMLGAAKSEMGHHEDAAKAFAAVTDDIPSAKYNLAVVKLEAKEYGTALQLFDELETAQWEAPADMYFFKAEAHFYTGDKREACLAYSTAANMGDEEAQSIYDSYCLKSRKKATRKKRDVMHIDL